MKNDFYAVISRSMLILLIVFAVYYVGPMLVAISTGGLNKEDIVKRLPPKVRKRYDQNIIAIAKIDKSLDSMDNVIFSSKVYDYNQLTFKIHYLNRRKELLASRFSLDGLNFNHLTLIYPVSISLLAILYFIFLKGRNRFSFAKHIKIIIPVYIFLMCFTWYRNTPYGQYGRTIFSAYNFDVDPYEFFCQEFCVFSFVTLIVMIWHKRVTELANIENINLENVTTEKLMLAIQDLKREYYSWQFLSVILFGVFGFFSFHFWSNVFERHDSRYIYQAIIFNMLWIITWIICSVPTIQKFEKWDSFKIKVLIHDFKEESLNDLNYDRLHQYLCDKEIVSDLNKTFSTVVLILSFLFPLLKAWI